MVLLIVDICTPYSTSLGLPQNALKGDVVAKKLNYKLAMKKIFFTFMTLLIFIMSNSQTPLKVSDLEKILELDISQTSDYLTQKKYQFLGCDSSSLNNGSINLIFGKRKPLELKMVITFDKKDIHPSIVSYDCSEAEQKSKKQYYLNKGFKLTKTYSGKDFIKYLYEKVNSYFSIVLLNSYNRETLISTTGIQLCTNRVNLK